MGVNGITEAFVQAVGSAAALNRQMKYMIGFWFIYMGSSYLSISVGGLSSSGLVLSNIVNMTLRICFSIAFINSYFSNLLKKKKKENILLGFIPGTFRLFFSFVVSFIITWSLKGLPMHFHILVGIICFSISCTIFYQSSERVKLIHDFRSLSSSKEE